MDIERFREYCLNKPGATEHFPFDEVTLVFKVGDKIFSLCGLDETPPRVNLKCDPERALALREHYPSILPGYHMSKKHWNTVILDGSLPEERVTALIDHSYELVYQSLSLKLRSSLKDLP